MSEFISLIIWIVDKLLANGRVFVLKSPVKVEFALEEDVWVIASPTLNIHAFGETPESAFSSFREDFAEVYDQIACTPDPELTQDALSVKRTLNSVIESVV